MIYIVTSFGSRNPETLAQLNDLPKVTQKVVLELDLEPMTYIPGVCTINYYSDTLEEKHIQAACYSTISKSTIKLFQCKLRERKCIGKTGKN